MHVCPCMYCEINQLFLIKRVATTKTRMVNATSVSPTVEWNEISQQDVGSRVDEAVIVKLVVQSLFLVFGTFGNSLIIGVYWRKVNKTTTDVLIMGLAWSDLFVSLLRFRNITYFVALLAVKEIGLFFHLMKVFNVLALENSVLTMGLIAIDRFDCVCRPHNRLFNKRRTQVALLCSFAFSIIILLPLALETAVPSLKIKNITLIFQLIGYITVLVTIIVCYGRVYSTIRRQVKVGGRVLNNKCWTASSRRPTCKTQQVNSVSRNISQSCQSAKWYDGSDAGTSFEQSTFRMRQSETTHQKSDKRCHTTKMNRIGHLSDLEERDPANEPSTSNTVRVHRNPPSVAVSAMRAAMQRSVTRMLLITSVVFLLTWLPYWIFVALSLAKLRGGEIGDDVLTMLSHITISVPFNSVVNPLIYGVANKRFRKDCKEFCRKNKCW